MRVKERWLRRKEEQILYEQCKTDPSDQIRPQEQQQSKINKK